MPVGPISSGGNVHPGGAQPNKSLPQNVQEALDHVNSTLKQSLGQVHADKQTSASNAAFNAAIHKGEGWDAAFNASMNASMPAFPAMPAMPAMPAFPTADNAGENPASNVHTQLQSAVSTALENDPNSAKQIVSSLNTLSANVSEAAHKIGEDSSVNEVNDAAKSISDLVTNEIAHLLE
jgi:hypothetical protein